LFKTAPDGTWSDHAMQTMLLIAAVVLTGCAKPTEKPMTPKSETTSADKPAAATHTAGSTRFTFKSGGDTLVGTLYVPDGEPVGLVLTSGPLTSVKEQAAGAYARAMAERGFVALAFDHRHFGESGGKPRQLEKPSARVEDIRSAATALLADSRFAKLPVFGLGICFGAGPMAVAVSEDARFRGLAGVAGVYTDVEKTRASMGEAKFQAAIDSGRKAERAWEETGIAEMIPAVAEDNGNVAMPLREAYEFYGTPRGAVPNYVNGFAVQSRAHLVPFDAMHVATDMRAPVIIVHSERALLPVLAREFYAALKAPRKELWLASQGQIDFYDDPKLIAPSADAVATWFGQHRQTPAP
jgi:uncharacterized protein